MTCSDYRLLIPFRKTGDLLPEDAGLLDAHLASCPACSLLAAPSPADTAIQNAFQSVTVPSGLKERVSRAVAVERRTLAIQRLGRFGLLAAILVLLGFASWGVNGWMRPKLDTETIGIWNGFEADESQVRSLVLSWIKSELKSENLLADMPLDFDFKYFASHGYEKWGRVYVPVVKFQNHSNSQTGSFAKVYFVRGSEVDVRNAVDNYGSICTVRVFPGANGITYLLVHTGSEPPPYISLAANRIVD